MDGPSESILQIQKMYAQVPQDCLNRQMQLHVIAKTQSFIWNRELNMDRMRRRKSVCFPDPFFVHDLQETNPFTGLE